MPESFVSLAPHLARHPFLLTIALFVLLRWAAEASRLPAQPATRLAGLGLAAPAICAIPAYIGVVIFYLRGPGYFDAAEPTMTAVGWLFAIGAPVHHAVDSAERYAHIYGPAAFMVHGWAMAALGPSIEASKSVGGVMALSALALTAWAIRPATTAGRTLVLTGLYALLLLGFRNYSFWTRAEPLQLFCIAAALAGIVRGRGPARWILVGASVGVLWNLKITGPLYGLPLLVLLVTRAGWSAAALAVGVASVTALAPFIAFPNVSAEAYFAWLRLSAQTGLLLSTLRQNLEWAAFLGIPFLLACFASRHPPGRLDRESALLALATLGGAVGVIIAGSKPGAGPYHLLPLLPIVFYLAAVRLAHDDMRPAAHAPHAALAFGLVASFVAIGQQSHFVLTMATRPSAELAREIDQFARTHRGVVEMGYGVNDPLTFERPLLVFRNGSYFLDQPAVGEHQLAGIPLPAATIAALRRCRVAYWLVPRGETPFGAVNMYNAVRLQPLFSEDFRRAFLDAHDRIGATAHFDVWQCREP